MGRFDHLEMSNPDIDIFESEPDDSDIRDENYYSEQASEAYFCENYEKALAYYSRALQYNITLEECWLGQLQCLVDLGELHEAVVWSERALEKFPKSAPILAARAIAESRSGRKDTAMGFSDGSFSASGVTAYCWIARGEVLLSIKKGNSNACFSKAVEMSPSDWAVRAAIGRTLCMNNLPREAIAYFRQALQLDSSKYICWYWIGKCSESIRQYSEAEAAYRQVLSMCPSCTKAQEALALIARRGFLSRLTDAFRSAFRPS